MPSHDLGHVSHHDRIEAVIADVTCAVYQVVLSEVRPSNWLDLQLALWDVVRSRFEAWGLADGKLRFPCCDRPDFSHEDGLAISTHRA